ncbi:MAG: ATP-binding protein [Candidatus Saganbacteria bacterium]|nr:ATP-binding protein [Candidatus Saganbacteria bacterium]
MIGIKRDITEKALGQLESDLILLLIGARQTGKTTILKQIGESLSEKGLSFHFLNLEDPSYLALLNEHPRNLFKIFPLDVQQRSYIFIDEIQYLADPTNFLKYIYDEYKDKIKLIVSGSSSFYVDAKFKDSLAGRKKLFEVRTLSFGEFLRFKGREELRGVLNTFSLSQREEIRLLYDEYLTWGGYPRVVLSPLQEKRELLQELVSSYIKKDIYETGIRQEEVFYKLLKILAAQTGNLVNVNELSRTLGVSKTAVENYLYVMQKSYHLALVRPFYRNVRKEMTKMPKVYFYDLGLRNFFYGESALPASRTDLGALLENAVFRQLLDRYQELDKIKFWRTLQKNEVDFVVDGKEAFEVKVTAKSFTLSKYRQFMKLYPEIKINLVVYDKEGKIPALESFEV